MSLPFKPSQRRLLVGSAIALALFASPFSYDFAHHQWQLNQAQAKSCFIAGTRILMADGSERPIDSLQAGELVQDQHGQVNRILAVERVLLGERRLYGLNNLPPFFTAEHPFLTSRGWAAVSPAMTRTENPALAVLPLFTGMRILCGPTLAASSGNLALAPQPGELPVESLYSVESPATTALFNLILDGSHSYIANSLIVHNKDGGGGSSSGGGGGGSGGGSSHGGGNDSSHDGGDDNGKGEHAGGDRHAGGDQHAGGDRHAGGRALDDDGNPIKLRGDGSVDDDGVDAVDADGNRLRGDGTLDDDGVNAVDADGNKLRGDGTVDDSLLLPKKQ